YPRGAAVGRVLHLPVSKYHGAVAPVPEPAAVGRVRSVNVLHGVAALLVHGPDSRPGHASRPVEGPGPLYLRLLRPGLARFGAALVPLRNGVPASRRYVGPAGGVGAHDRFVRLRGQRDPRLAHDNLPAV